MVDVALPVALGVVMFGLGLSLTAADFKRAARSPKVVLIALFCQLVVLPLLCLLLVWISGLRDSGGAGPFLAAGFLLLAASPGGATASLFSHLFRGDVALNVTLLAVNSVLSVLTLPIVVNAALAHFLGRSQSLGLQVGDTLKVFVIVLVPIVLGMAVRRTKSQWALGMDKPVRFGSVLVLVVVVAGAVVQEGDRIRPYIGRVGLIAVVFCLMNLAVGYVVPRLLRVDRRSSIAVSMEIGVHNETLAITVALSVLNQDLLAIAPAIYALVKFAIIPLFGLVVSRGVSTELVPTDQVTGPARP